MTTVFDCDVSRVLAHRKKLRAANVEVLLASYFLVALAEAQHSAPELTGGAAARFGVALLAADGEQRMARLDAAAAALGDSLDSRLHAFDAALRQSLDTDTVGANLLVHHYGDSGSILATPTPLGVGHAASVGIGRVRREIVVRNVDGVESPRVTSRCYLSLSFLPDRIALHRANRFMVVAVHVIEHWPE
jgi:pyruvate/2-oxoglutarate dehydrogenase complex dihydrolipoamide acyltransferase (E2) component